MTIYCIDIDDTLCHSIEDDYASSSPCPDAIKKINALFDQGHTIKLFTGRGSYEEYDWREFTEKQLEKWGVKYHELIMGKPHADFYIDDKAINTADWIHRHSDKIIEVGRDWGKEVWLVNCDEYCAKLLYLPKNAYSGEHYHDIKKETFWCLRGNCVVTLKGKEYMMDPFSRPITILPKEKHTFKSHSNCLILEISTHHAEDDVTFLSSGYKPKTSIKGIME